MLLRQMLREHRFLVVGYFVFMIVNIAPAMIFWPNLRSDFDALTGLGRLIPVPMVQDIIWMIDEHGYWAYFGIQQFFKGGGVAAMIAGSILGGLLIAREVDNRTAEFLFSRPISRARLLLVRWGTGAAMIVLPFVLVTLGAWLISPAIGESLPAAQVLLATLHVSLFAVAVFTVAVMLSTFFEHQLKPGLVVVGVMMLQMAFYLVKIFWEWSVYRMIDLDRLIPIAEGTYPWAQSLTFVGVTAACLTVAWIRLRALDF